MANCWPELRTARQSMVTPLVCCQFDTSGPVGLPASNAEVVGPTVAGTVARAVVAPAVAADAEPASGAASAPVAQRTKTSRSGTIRERRGMTRGAIGRWCRELE